MAYSPTHMAERLQTRSPTTASSASATMLPTSYPLANARCIEAVVVATGITTVSGSDVASQYSMPHTDNAPLLFAEPPHPVDDNADCSNDEQIDPNDPHLGLMPDSLSCTLATPAGMQESEDVYDGSMPSTSAASTTMTALGCAAAPTLQASFTPGASTSITPAPVEAHSASGTLPFLQHRWVGNYDSGSRRLSFRGADRSTTASGYGLRLVGDDVEWLQGSFEDSTTSPREEVQPSWQHLQHQKPTDKSNTARAMPPTLSDAGASAVRKKVPEAHYHFERAVQSQPQRQTAYQSTDEEDSQAAAMLWAAQQMAALE
nr:unnamed protein product [Leishmania braziliensis]